MNQETQEFWQRFCQEHHLATDSPVDCWSFGTDADDLAKKVRDGIKTATTSAYEMYENEPLPQVGELSIILDSSEKPVCVVREKVVEIIPYNQISAEHAYHEGEGDYEEWRKIHDRFFEAEYRHAGKEFYPQAPMVCEVFEKVE